MVASATCEYDPRASIPGARAVPPTHAAAQPAAPRCQATRLQVQELAVPITSPSGRVGPAAGSGSSRALTAFNHDGGGDGPVGQRGQQGRLVAAGKLLPGLELGRGGRQEGLALVLGVLIGVVILGREALGSEEVGESVV